jgi:hypothetical protein
MKKLLSIIVLSLLFSGNGYTEIIKLEKCIRWHNDRSDNLFVHEYAEYLEIDFNDYNGDDFNEAKWIKFKDQKWSKKAYDLYNTIWFDRNTSMFTKTMKTSSSVFSAVVSIESSFTINTDEKSIIEYHEYTDDFVTLSNRHHRTDIDNYNKENSTNEKPYRRKKFRKNVIELTGNAGDRFFGVREEKFLPKKEYTFDLKRNEIIYFTDFPAFTETITIKCTS